VSASDADGTIFQNLRFQNFFEFKPFWFDQALLIRSSKFFRSLLVRLNIFNRRIGEVNILFQLFKSTAAIFIVRQFGLPRNYSRKF